VRTINVSLAINNLLVTFGKNFRYQIKASGIARIGIFGFSDHDNIGFQIIRHGGNDVYADIMICFEG